MRTTKDDASAGKWFTVYQDRFVIAYFTVLALYLLIGFFVFFLPFLDPGGGHRNPPRIGYLIVPMFWLAAVTLAIIGVALRAAWALKFYPRTVKPFLVILTISSILTFLDEGLIMSILITIPVVLFSLPLLLVLQWGLRYLKRTEVRDSFAQRSPDRP